MAVNVKLGVDLTSFKKGITDANAQLKTFDAQLKFAETTFKKTGDAEAAMSTKTDALTNKLKTQKQVVQQYDKALRDMRTAGVDPLSKEYQQMAAAMLNAQSAANETEIALNNLNTTQMNAAASADKLTQSVNSIGKKMSLDQVITGIDKITGGLEKAAKKAIQVGENIWKNILDSARLADDTGTAAMLLDMDVEEYQKYKGVFDTIAEMTVTDWMNAKRKIQQAIYKPSDDQATVLSLLGVNTHTMSAGKYGMTQNAARKWEDVFWEAAQELRKRIDSGRISADLGDTYAEALFGKKAAQLKPLIDLGRDAFTAALGVQNVASKEAIEKDAKLADTVTKLTASYESLKMELTSGFSPALTTLAESLDSLLGRILEYLQTDEGKEMLKSLGDAVSGLFTDLSKIDPQQVVEGFVGVFEKIIGGFEWLLDNKNGVIHALEAIVIGWAGLKLTGGALEIMKLINGVQTFNGIDTGTPQNVTGGDGTVLATGTSGGGFWSKLLNGATLFAVADAMYKATEGQIRSNVDNFNKATEGMTDAQKNREALRIGFGMTDEDIDEYIDKINQKRTGGHDLLLPTELEPEENAAGKLAEEVGTVVLPAQLHILGGTRGIGTGGENMMRMLGETANASYSYANGLPFVPYDGYLARLHKGERVMTASQNRSYSANSNLYIENMNMNNGMDAQALASAMSAQNRRISAGFGS